ncbi:hypothetical protein BAU15_04845 [Enterococcus sp. JM4C]|uniref:DUF4097 family beta strand repeat-containing protein n=1 Tax=Candidatus Enterococcus huntleyi TaxID=1857217 RepID=UPI00137B3F4C|nr:DUF4097 family beta strand repeat-containing protein [Enterococcus sp. JM4C]KAF1295086.1 hypothetical protein BAU15_04845 [Enterococcus sp. JM4C]
MKKLVIGLLVIVAIVMGVFVSQSAEKKIEKQMVIGTIERINLTSQQWDIEILAGDEDKVEVAMAGLITDELLDIKVEGSTLKIAQKGEQKDYFGGFSFRKSRKIKVWLPKNSEQEITIISQSGSIDIGESTIDKLDCRTESGDISLSKVTGRTHVIESTHGDILVSDNQADQLFVRTKSGDIGFKKFNEKELTEIESEGDEVAISFHQAPENITAKLVAKEIEAEVFGKEIDPQAIKVGEGQNQLTIKNSKGSIVFN